MEADGYGTISLPCADVIRRASRIASSPPAYPPTGLGAPMMTPPALVGAPAPPLPGTAVPYPYAPTAASLRTGRVCQPPSTAPIMPQPYVSSASSVGGASDGAIGRVSYPVPVGTSATT